MAAWADLLPELLMTIGKCLHTSVDILRFRSVCKSWRNSLPFAQTDLFPVSHNGLRLPWTDAFHGAAEGPFSPLEVFSLLVRNTVCFLRRDATSCGWLVKVLESQKLGAKKSLRHPFFRSVHFDASRDRIDRRSWDLNVLSIAIFQDSRFYTLVEELRYEDYSHQNHSKALVYPDSVWSRGDDLCVLTLPVGKRNLRLLRSGDEKWTKIDNPEGSRFDDIAICEDQFFAVDATGAVFSIDRSNRSLVRCSLPIGESNSVSPKKSNRLVVSGGYLFVIERFFQELDEEEEEEEEEEEKLKKVVGFKINRLNRKTGCWVEVRDLGSQALVLGAYDTFFVSTKDFVGCRANCIYYRTLMSLLADQSGPWYWDSVCRFNITDGSIFWPEPFMDSRHPTWPPLPIWLRELADLSFCWTPPPIDCLKFNVDVIFTRGGIPPLVGAAIGGVLRDCNGDVVTTFGKHLGGVESRESAGLLAVLEALLRASKSDLRKTHKLIIETESWINVSCFCNPETRPLEHTDDFAAADEAIQSFKQVVFQNTSKEANVVARCFAAQAIYAGSSLV